MAALRYAELQSRPLTSFDYEPLQEILDDKLVGDFFCELYAPPRRAAVAREHWESLRRAGP